MEGADADIKGAGPGSAAFPVGVHAQIGARNLPPPPPTTSEKSDTASTVRYPSVATPPPPHFFGPS